jgi:LEA14-like dessication related protein
MKPISSRVHPVSLLFLVTLISGCASLGNLEPPELTLVQLQPSEVTLFETTLQVRLRIANPNPEAIAFDGASFKLTLDDRKVGRGMTPETRTIERFATEVIEVTFHVSNASVLLRLQEVLESKTVSYGVSGKLYLKQGANTRKIKVQSAGEIDLNSSPTSLDPDSLVPETST